MANIGLYLQKLIALEGGYVNDPDDHGQATKMGITLATWKEFGYDKDNDGDIDADDILLLSREDVQRVLKRGFWDRWQADLIFNQSVAEQLVDWTWTSGKWGIIWPQRLLGIKADGIVGNYSIASVNSVPSSVFHGKVQVARMLYVQEICRRDPSQQKFLKGWLNRIHSFKFS